jgi:general secretion pathway protein K
MSRRTQRGVALLTAVLLVALATIVASALAYRNAMTARRGAATFAFEQALLFAQGAEALAAYALRQDADSGSNETDNYGDRWAEPYGPIEIAPGVVLEARLEDLTGRFNLNTLVENGQVNEFAVDSLRRLLQKLDLDESWAPLIADWIDQDPSAHFPDGGEDSLYLSQDPPYRPPNQPITSVSELLALPGFGRERYLKLAPHVAALPGNTPFNVCSGTAAVLDAYRTEDEFTVMPPEDFAKKRDSECVVRQTAYEAPMTPDHRTKVQQNPGLAEKSEYFRLRSIVSIGTSEFALYSLLHRENGRVKVVMRSYSPD